MGLKKEQKREFACVYESAFYKGDSLKEAWDECVDFQSSVDTDEVEFYELRSVKVKFDVVEVAEPVEV